MFSMMKVMISLLTSLLTFLAIDLTDMDKEAFRARFKAYKEGKPVSEIYDRGTIIPYRDGDYNYSRANELGYTPDKTGHMPSRDYETGMYLKRPTHFTIMKSIVSDLGEGYIPWYNKEDGLLYSHRWPDDLPGYEIGKLPRYSVGTPGGGTSQPITYSDDEAFDYIAALENPGRVGWDGKVWRVPKGKGYDHNALAYGLDIREEHNPDVYNYLKSKGRLNDPYLTDKEARILAMKSYRSKDDVVQRAIKQAGGNISQRGYNVLRGMAWHGHPMKVLLNKDSITGKAFQKAIANGDADLDSVFDAYYLYPGNKTRYAERIKADASYRNKSKSINPIPIKKSELVQQMENLEEFKPWSNYHGPDYPINNPAPYTISSWNNQDSPAFSQPALMARRSINLLPKIQDIAPSIITGDDIGDVLINNLYNTFGGIELGFNNGKLPSYSNGKISIKPANRGKLTRLKQRTGKSESELYNDGNPAHKKMVVFARNARKWKH